METKITKGDWEVWPLQKQPIRICAAGTPTIAEVPLRHVSINEQKANAELIAEAGTVTNQTGLSPMKLLEQRNELLTALIELYNSVDCCTDLTPEILKNAREAIKKAQESKI